MREIATDAARALAPTTLKAARLAASLLDSNEKCRQCRARRATTISRMEGQLVHTCEECAASARLDRRIRAQRLHRERLRQSHV